jgi:YYY domain-containing protein
MIDAAAWYIALLLVGLAGLLPAMLLCERLPSQGVLYARVVGLAVVALAAWLIGWSELLPYGTAAIGVALLALFAWSTSIAWRRRDLLARVREQRRPLLAGEAVLLAVFVLLALARAQAPDAVNTEKPMDLMLLVAVHRAEVMPPPDPWLAGADLSYYHLGHTALDVLGRLSGNGTGIAFNLGVATAGALAAVVALGLIADLLGLTAPPRRRVVVAAGTVGLLTLLMAATVPGLVQVLAGNGIGGQQAWGWLGVDNVPVEAGATSFVPDAWLWWWSATRVLPDTITEFPAFSLLLGDPHAHLLAVPLVLMVVVLAVQTFEGGTPLTWRRWLRMPDQLALTAILFAGLAMTNAWDLITLGPLWGLAAVAAAIRVGWSPLGALLVAVRWAIAPAVLALALAWPFLGGLDTPGIGVALVTDEHSDPLRWLLVWLPPLLPGVVALGFLAHRPERRHVLRWSMYIGGAFLAWLGLALGSTGTSAITNRAEGWITIGVLAAVLVLVGTQVSRAEAARRRDESTALALFGAGLALLLLLELVMVDDAFPGRMNSVFKFGFQAWLLLALSSGALVGIVVARFEDASDVVRVRIALVGYVLVVALFLLSLYTPAMAVSRGREGQESGLDATRHLAAQHPGIHAAALWSREHLDPRDHVLVQAVGESYTRGNRVSTFSAVPTILAWPNHQRQWRGEIAESQRRAAVDAIYAGDEAAAAPAITRWGVTHVLIGPHEREVYGADLADRFADWPVVLDAHEVLILEVPR